MKNIFLKIGDPVANITQLSSVVANNIDTSNISKIQQNKKVIDDKFLRKLGNELQNQNRDLIDKFTNLMLDKKISGTKVAENLQKDDLKAFSKTLLTKLLKENKISQEDYNKYINTPISDSMFENFKREFKKYSIQTKKEVIVKYSPKKFKDSLKRVTIDYANSYKLNIIDGEINSKKISLEFNNLEKKAKEIIKLRNEIKNNLKYWTEVKRDYVAANIGLGISSFFVGIFSIFAPVLVLGSLALTTASFLISQKINEINYNIEIADLKVKYYGSLISQTDDPITALKILHGNIWAAGSAESSLISLASQIAKKVGKPQNWSTLKALGDFFSKKKFIAFAAINDAIEVGFNSHELYLTNQRIAYINKKEKEINNSLSEIYQRIEELKKYNWVVINETEQTDFYWNGGRGGKNLVFKNLQTGEIKAINELLKYSDFELRAQGLQKVYDHKKGFYIRKIKNSSKEDNLG
ncbi:hypothetical protein NPA08_03865 [Mycoplasmopsis citelli]|uniref:hypothetical protein n=1 Tax=Mycoplasmopsis citelli TaxID=171281 RepID=UPI002115BD0D|nr:hypothetical protein [Mycoplasmopsis citelli]UUD36063.1 hypothetical protein NPA08_03865 [Mycoplasmopsis citelli]